MNKNFKNKYLENRNKKNNENNENNENVNEIIEKNISKHGEFISSYFCWTTLNKKKRRAEELENMTKVDNENKEDVE